MEDGLILMYVKDGVIYPIAMTESQYNLLQILGGSIFGGEPIKVIDKPQGSATNLLKKKV